MSKFAATYFINKYPNGDNGFAYELLDLHAMFDNIYEESCTVGEWTDTYDEAVSYLVDKPEGEYSVFIIGEISYSTDYWGESDIDVEIEYHKVGELPEEFVESVGGQ